VISEAGSSVAKLKVTFRGGTLPATGQKSATQSTIKVLYGESDQNTLSAQAAEMTKAGHHVTTALNRQGVLEALRRDAFDLVILGSTLSKDDRHHLPYMVKKAHEGTKVLVMHAGTHHHEVDAAIDPSLSMQRILEKIAALLQPASV
jgi:DNA-binding NtrC family response regulator